MAFELKLNPKLIFDITKKSFPIIYKYINYLNYLFIFIFFILTLVASILFINAYSATSNLVDNSNDIITFSIGKRFFLWIYNNKMAYNLAISAASFGVLSCSSIILDVSKMILDKNITKLKLSLYSVSLILILIVTIMLFYGFLNTTIATSLSYDANGKPTINVINQNGNSIGGHSIPWEKINESITNPNTGDPQATVNKNELSISQNYKIFLGSIISVAVVGNGLLISSKLINGKKIKLIFDGFAPKKDDSNNIVFNDDTIEIKTSYLTFYGKKIALNYFIYFDYVAILLVILFLSFGLASYVIFFDSTFIEKSFLTNYLGKTIEITENTHLNWNIHNIAWNNKLLIILGFISSSIGLLLSLSIIVNIIILGKNKLLSKVDIVLRIVFSIMFFIIPLLTILAYNNSGIVVDIQNNKLVTQGSKILEYQKKIISVTSINWDDLNIIGKKINVTNELLKGNYIAFLSTLISLIFISSISYIIYKIIFFKNNYSNIIIKYNN